MEGAPTIVARRAGLRPSPRQVLRNEDMATPGGDVEGLPAIIDRRAGLCTSVHQVFHNDDIVDADDSCGSTTCNGLGTCNVANGNPCATNINQECLSNICILGTCANASPVGGNCDETVDCQQGVCNSDNVCRVPGYTLADNGLLTNERVADRDDSFDVVLTSKPNADVTLTISTSNTAEAVSLQSSLVFSGLTWDTPQTVTIRGQNDNVADGSQPYTVTLEFSSADSDYAALDNITVNGTNVDDDIAGVNLYTLSPDKYDKISLQPSDWADSYRVKFLNFFSISYPSFFKHFFYRV